MEFVRNYPNPHCIDEKRRLPAAFGGQMKNLEQVLREKEKQLLDLQ
jgi:hypothetical protein